jgi:hypothetical protein
VAERKELKSFPWMIQNINIKWKKSQQIEAVFVSSQALIENSIRSAVFSINSLPLAKLFLNSTEISFNFSKPRNIKVDAMQIETFFSEISL